MSELTKCNYCLLESIKKSNPGKEVKLVRDDSKTICNLQVTVDGEGIGIWFWTVSDHCVC